MSKIKVAIIGVGNCASALIQGIQYYKKHFDAPGIMYPVIGPYTVSDIEIVAAFDVDVRKVGKDISEAIISEPNCTKIFFDVPNLGVVVQKGVILDGIASQMKEHFKVDDTPSADIVQTIKNSGAHMCICYLPVGSAKAARFYAQVALDAGVAFINAIPEFICSSKEWRQKFEERGLVCVGDDIKSQVGATIIHRTLARLLQDRGHAIQSTYQLNIGGNTDFLNMKDGDRISSKRISKTNAVTSILDGDEFSVCIGPSDYIPHLKDNKICYINFKGTQFGGVPFEIDLKLSVEDSPNSAGVITEVIRAVRIAQERGLRGNINDISAYTFKTPVSQVRDDQAKRNFEAFITADS